MVLSGVLYVRREGGRGRRERGGGGGGGGGNAEITQG